MRVLLVKELREHGRDGRARLVVGVIALLIAVSLIAGWSTHAEQRRQTRRAQSGDQAAFLDQGEKPPHSAAHFGRMAYRPAPALAVFDPGGVPFLGQVIWLEAHARNPAMFRPAEDAPELSRLADLSVAGILTLLVPLVVFVLGHGAFAAERERGTLRLLLVTGVSIDRLFVGKTAVAAGIASALSLTAIGASVALALTAPGGERVVDTLLRGAFLVAAHGCYGLACAAIALLVSARARTGTSALLVLLGVWAASFVILPRVAAGAADQLHPTPDGGRFQARAARRIRERRPARDSEAYRAAERQVLSRALGRPVTAEEAASMPLNRAGLGMEVSEVLGAAALDEIHEELHAIYAAQKRVRRTLSLLSPAIALQHLSSALAGTDVAAHRDFARQAEEHRLTVVRALNEDMMLRGTGQGFAYLADPDLWARVPAFRHRPPPPSAAIRAAAPDLLILALWTVLAVLLARRAARRQPILPEAS